MKKITTIILFLATALCTFAEQLPQDQAIRQGTLANGLTYFIRHNDQTPGQADFYLAQKVGSILEEPQQRGLAHFLEHMAFNGTKNFPAGNGESRSIRSWCERNGIKFGADLNASTSIEETLYKIPNAPITKAGVADTCLLILHDWSGYLLLKDGEIDQERGVIREEWRTRRSTRAVQRMMEDATGTIYQGSKYADCLPIGNIDVVNTFKPQTLRDYYKKWYRPDLQAVIVVGDINVDDMEQKVKAVFGDIPAPQNPAERTYYTIPDNKEMIVYTQTDDEQPTVNFSLFMKRTPCSREEKNTKEEFLNGYRSRLAMFILRQRLSELPKAEHPVVMSATCRDGAFYFAEAEDALTINVGLMPDKLKEGVDAVMEVVEKARAYGFTESELQHAKEQHNVNLEHRLDNKDKTRNGEYIGQIVHHFCDGEPLMAIEQEADIEHAMMESVTLADVNETIKELVFDPSKGEYNQVCIVYGPTKWNEKPYTLPAKEEWREWVLAAEQKHYENTNVNKPIDRTFMKKLPKKGKIVKKEQADFGYTKYTLSNGINVYARASELEPNRLTLNMQRLGGESLYPDEDMASLKYLGTVVVQSGAADFDFLTLEKKRIGKALRVTPFIGQEEEGVKGVCAASDFKTWLEIMYLYVTQPRRDDKIFNSIMERQASILKNRNASPQVAFNDSLREAVYGKSLRTEPMTVDRLKDVSLDRIYEIYRERFSNMAGMNFCITGDIRTDELEDLLCQYVASLPGKENGKRKKENAAPTYLDIQKGKVTNVFEHTMKTPSALTEIVYSAPVEYTPQASLHADVLAQVMRQIYTEKVREEKGGTYGVSVSSQCWKRPNDGVALKVNFRCDPKMYAELIPIIDEQLQQMAQNGPTDEQLQRIKEYEQKNYDRVILTNGYWEYLMTNELLDGVNLDKDYMQMVNAITKDDIKNICKSIISSGNRIQVTMK